MINKERIIIQGGIIMIYGIFLVICLVGSSILLGQGIHKNDIRITLPSTVVFFIGMILVVFWMAETM